jgi:hypothetical protein
VPISFSLTLTDGASIGMSELKGQPVNSNNELNRVNDNKSFFINLIFFRHKSIN